MGNLFDAKSGLYRYRIVSIVVHIFVNFLFRTDYDISIVSLIIVRQIVSLVFLNIFFIKYQLFNRLKKVYCLFKHG